MRGCAWRAWTVSWRAGPGLAADGGGELQAEGGGDAAEREVGPG